MKQQLTVGQKFRIGYCLSVAITSFLIIFLLLAIALRGHGIYVVPALFATLALWLSSSILQLGILLIPASTEDKNAFRILCTIISLITPAFLLLTLGGLSQPLAA